MEGTLSLKGMRVREQYFDEYVNEIIVIVHKKRELFHAASVSYEKGRYSRCRLRDWQMNWLINDS